MTWRPGTIHQFILAAAALILYFPTLDYPFQFDGVKEIRDNQAIADIGDLGRIWNYNPSRFIVFLSFAFNRHFGGDDTFGYHLVNISLHLANTLLLYHLIALLFATSTPAGRDYDGANAGGWAAFAAALIFAVHPLQTEAVTYIWQRSSSMGAMFYLISMLAYLKASLSWRESAPPVRWMGWLAFSVISAIAGMFTKQFCFTIFFAAALLEYCVVSRSWRGLREKAFMLWPLAPTLAIVPFLTFFYARGEIADITARAAETPTPYSYFLTQLNIITLYLRLFIYPSGQNLDHDIPISASFFSSAPSFVLLAALLALGFWLWRSSPMASFGIFFFFVSMSVESSFFPLPDIVFEHRMYLPLAGLLITMAALARMSPRASIIMAAALAGSIALSVATWQRNGVWATPQSLWEDVVSKSPQKWRGYLKLGAIHKRQGNWAEAEKMYEQVVRLAPGVAEANHDLGVLKKMAGDLETAEKLFQNALKLKPSLYVSSLELGRLHMEQKRLEEAQQDFALVTQTEPRFFLGWYFLGRSLEELGKMAEAQRAYQQALALRPENAELPGRLARVKQAQDLGQNPKDAPSSSPPR